MTTKLALIAAVDRKGGIGKDNGLLWREPLDQRHFRQTTLGCPVVMGRKTWDSLPARFRPLPGRRNVVVTRNPAAVFDGAHTANSLPQALALLAGEAQVFVIGGAQLYTQALPLADTLVLTEIDQVLPADTFFPQWHRQDWTEVSRVQHQDAQGQAFAFVTYQRKA